MPRLTRSLRLRRFLGGTVAALLTANAFAVALHGGDDGTNDRLRRPATEEGLAPPIEMPSRVSLITSRDGRTFVADPATAEGRRAIDEARRDGSTIREITIPDRAPSTRPDGRIAVPDLLGEDGLLDLHEVVGGLTGDRVPDGDDRGPLGLDPGLPGDVIDDPVGTVTSVVDDPVGTVTSVVDDAGTTVTSLATSTPSTITSVVEDAGTTVSSLAVQLPGTTATSAPSTTSTSTTGPLGGVVTTVASLIQRVTSTTQAPTTTSTTAPPDDAVCTLLVLC